MLASNVHAAGHINSSPVRTWGDISTTYRTRDYVGTDSEASNWLNTASINASSYIWRPWFATARGGLTLSLDESDFSEQPSQKNQYITGNAGLDLFPSSRFPSQVYYRQSRNELDDDLLNRNIETTEFNLRQHYRTVDNAHRLRAEYINNTREDPSASDIEGNRLLFSSNSQIENNSLGTDFQLDTIEDRFQTEKTDSFAVTGRHSYNSENGLSISNLVSTSEVENDFIRSVTDIETAEFSSLLFWRPGTEKTLSVTGNLRLSDQLLQQTDDLSTINDESMRMENATANLNQGLLYQYSDNLLIRETINANQLESGDNITQVLSETVGFTYTADHADTSFGGYGWNFGSSYVHEHGDIETNNILNNRFSHSLGNRYTLGERRQLRTNLTQSFGHSSRSRGFDRETIDHSFSVTWSQSSSVDQAVVSLQLLDARAREEDDELFQLANLQFNGLLRFDRFTQLSGNATLQWTRREDGSDETTGTVSNGRLEYMRSRLFGVPRLIFRSRLMLSQQQSETEQLIADVIDNEDSDRSWENSLDYLIGRLEARVNLDFVKANGDYDRIFKIQLTRSFGDL
ncbi:MAG: hypothetical protein OER87_05725 [Gammaproteobacteria bacterium]|nr:hypothetical protein [Gammaproteobacteria bacterium]